MLSLFSDAHSFNIYPGRLSWRKLGYYLEGVIMWILTLVVDGVLGPSSYRSPSSADCTCFLSLGEITYASLQLLSWCLPFPLAFKLFLIALLWCSLSPEGKHLSSSLKSSSVNCGSVVPFCHLNVHFYTQNFFWPHCLVILFFLLFLLYICVWTLILYFNLLNFICFYFLS